MKIDFSDYYAEPREMVGNTIDVMSTSAKTAAASPIILKNTDMVQSKFEPNLIDNEKDPKKSVSGKIIYERKKKKDNEFPSEKITRQSVKSGDIMEISLSSTETLNFFEGLKSLYSLFEDIGAIPAGSNTYTKTDNTFREFQRIIQNDPSAARLIAHEDNFELVKILLQLITQTDSIESLKSSLKELASSNIQVLSNAINIEHLERILNLLKENMDNSSEEFWQETFKENQWVLSQLFSYPCTIFEDKAYLGGKGLDNTGGKICDFIYQNNLTQNVVLIEIKTPCTNIVGNKYRGTYSLSSDMSGAINQILNYKDILLKNYYSLLNQSSEDFNAFNPKGLVLIGRIADLGKPQISTFENYRNSHNNIQIIAFDELLQKIEDMISIFKNDNKEDNSNESFDSFNDEEDELPF